MNRKSGFIGLAILLLLSVSLAFPPVLLASLNIPWYPCGQFCDQRQARNDCGTCCAAMAAEAYGKRLPTITDHGEWMQKIRDYSGKAEGWLSFEDVERVFDNPNINLGHRRIERGDGTGIQLGMQKIINALSEGYPVLALINPNIPEFGRIYNGHWVILKDFDSFSLSFTVNDPDTRCGTCTVPGGENQVWSYNLLKKGIEASHQDYAIVVGGVLELTSDLSATSFVDRSTYNFEVSFRVRNPNPILSITPKNWGVMFSDPAGDGFYANTAGNPYVSLCQNCYNTLSPGQERTVTVRFSNVQEFWSAEELTANGAWQVGPVGYCAFDGCGGIIGTNQLGNPYGKREEVCVNVCCFGTGAQGAGKEASLLGCPNYCGSSPTSTPIPTEGPRPTATLTPDRREVILLDPNQGANLQCDGREMLFRWMGSVAWYRLEVYEEGGALFFSSGWTRNTSCYAPKHGGYSRWKVYGGHTEGDFRYVSEERTFYVNGCTPTPRPRSPTSTKTVTKTLTKTPTSTVTRTSTRRSTPTSVRPSRTPTFTKTPTATKTPTVTRTLVPTRTSTPIVGPKVRVRVKAIDGEGRGLPDFYFRCWYSTDARFNNVSPKFKTESTGWAQIYLPGERLNIIVGPESPFPGTFCRSGKVSFEPEIRQGWNQTYFQTSFTFSCGYKIYLPKILTSPPLR